MTACSMLLESEAPSTWSPGVKGADDVPVAVRRGAAPRRKSWLEWIQLLYSERHLHPEAGGSRVARGSLCMELCARLSSLLSGLWGP